MWGGDTAVLPHRTWPRCSSVPTSWTRRIFSANLTPSWSFTAAMRTGRERYPAPPKCSDTTSITAGGHSPGHGTPWGLLMSPRGWAGFGEVGGVSKNTTCGVMGCGEVCHQRGDPLVPPQLHHLPQDGGGAEHAEPGVAGVRHPGARPLQRRPRPVSAVSPRVPTVSPGSPLRTLFPRLCARASSTPRCVPQFTHLGNGAPAASRSHP